MIGVEQTWQMFVQEKNTFLDFEYPESREDYAESNRARYLSPRRRSVPDVLGTKRRTSEGFLTFANGRLKDSLPTPSLKAPTIAAQLGPLGLISKDASKAAIPCSKLQEKQTVEHEPKSCSKPQKDLNGKNEPMGDSECHDQDNLTDTYDSFNEPTSFSESQEYPTGLHESWSSELQENFTGKRWSEMSEMENDESTMMQSSFQDLFSFRLSGMSDASFPEDRETFDELGDSFPTSAPLDAIAKTTPVRRPFRGSSYPQPKEGLGNNWSQNQFPIPSTLPANTGAGNVSAQLASNDVEDVVEEVVQTRSMWKDKRSRPSQGQRQRYRKLLSKILEQMDDDPDAFNLDALDLPASVAEDAQQKAMLVRTLARHKASVRRQTRFERTPVPTR